jgi:hypothetical protein
VNWRWGPGGRVGGRAAHAALSLARCTVGRATLWLRAASLATPFTPPPSLFRSAGYLLLPALAPHGVALMLGCPLLLVLTGISARRDKGRCSMQLASHGKEVNRFPLCKERNDNLAGSQEKKTKRSGGRGKARRTDGEDGCESASLMSHVARHELRKPPHNERAAPSGCGLRPF